MLEHKRFTLDKGEFVYRDFPAIPGAVEVAALQFFTDEITEEDVYDILSQMVQKAKDEGYLCLFGHLYTADLICLALDLPGARAFLNGFEEVNVDTLRQTLEGQKTGNFECGRPYPGAPCYTISVPLNGPARAPYWVVLYDLATGKALSVTDDENVTDSESQGVARTMMLAPDDDLEGVYVKVEGGKVATVERRPTMAG